MSIRLKGEVHAKYGDAMVSTIIAIDPVMTRNEMRRSVSSDTKYLPVWIDSRKQNNFALRANIVKVAMIECGEAIDL
jgi:hypothetical protein